MPGPLQYGFGVKAFALNLVTARMVAISRVQKMLATLLGVTISESTILGYILQIYKHLEDWEKSAKRAILLVREKSACQFSV
ncbi:MAG: hypothetical protein IT291_06410 [Deltaproteobacteria bacterium]|nr:hypothetical protein [Deltaproteobacteria bacterium]